MLMYHIMYGKPQRLRRTMPDDVGDRKESECARRGSESSSLITTHIEHPKGCLISSSHCKSEVYNGIDGKTYVNGDSATPRPLLSLR